MIRTTGRALTALAAVVALSACGATDPTAATVGGSEISRADFEALGRASLTQSDPTGAEGAPDDRVSGSSGRDLLGQVILGELIESFLTDRDAVPSADALAEAPIPDWQADLPSGVLRPLQFYALGTEAIGPAVEDEAAVLYDAPANESGVLCPRLIVVATEEDAMDIIDELEDGGDFGELATERSTDASSAANGGIPIDPNDPAAAECLSASGLSADAPVGAAALPLTPGTWSAAVSAPIDQAGTMGWFVVMARPYDEVSAEVARLVGGQVITEYVQDVEVDVDPMFGRWDPRLFTVVAL